MNFFIGLGATMYTLAAVLTARALFQRWRPHRAPTCGKRQHFDQWDRKISHTSKCYRRGCRDLSYLPFDTDREAAFAAIAAGVIWWGWLVYLAVVKNPPETEPEKIMRQAKQIESMERKITDLEYSAGIR